MTKSLSLNNKRIEEDSFCYREYVMELISEQIVELTGHRHDFFSDFFCWNIFVYG